MPDFDVDFDERRRGDVIRYVTEKYGDDRVAQIVTYGTIKAKQAVKDSARVLGMPFSVGDRITKVMPPPVMGKDVPLAKIFDPSHDRYSEGGEFRTLVETDPDVTKVVEHGQGPGGPQAAVGGARGRRHHVLRAAARPDPDHEAGAGRRDHHPVRLPDLREARPDQDGLPGAAQPDHPGRRGGQHPGQPRRDRWSWRTCRSTTRPTYELLARGDTLGVFQLDGGPMRALLRSMRPDNFEDISAVIALYRPGPMGANCAQRVRRPQERPQAGDRRSIPSWPSRWPRSSATPTV